ncbi:MAG: hypothetical protein J6Q86_05715 [Methanobrevibacter sp.]|nr:hypothetical protein [Methanobrevibacter sp.]
MIYMGDMIKDDMQNFDLNLELRISVCPIFNCFGQNSSIFKTMLENGKF